MRMATFTVVALSAFCFAQEIPQIDTDAKTAKNIKELGKRLGVPIRRETLDPTGKYVFGVRGEGMLDVMAYDIERERLFVVGRLGYGQEQNNKDAFLHGEASVWPFCHFVSSGGYTAGYRIRDDNRNFHWDPGEPWEFYLIRLPSTTPRIVSISYTVPVFAFDISARYLFYAVTRKRGGETELRMRILNSRRERIIHRLGKGVECAYIAPSPDSKKVALLERYEDGSFCLLIITLKKKKILIEKDIKLPKGAVSFQYFCWLPDSSGLLLRTSKGVEILKLSAKETEPFLPFKRTMERLGLGSPDVYFVPTMTESVAVINVVKDKKKYTLLYHPEWKEMKLLKLPPETVVINLHRKRALILRGSGEYARTVVVPVRWRKRR